MTHPCPACETTVRAIVKAELQTAANQHYETADRMYARGLRQQAKVARRMAVAFAWASGKVGAR